MLKRSKARVKESPFIHQDFIEIDGFIINRGDIIKITGEHGMRFKFHSFVINPANGAQWIDCFEMHKTVASAWRSFRIERIKRIPVRRKRVSRRKRDSSSGTS